MTSIDHPERLEAAVRELQRRTPDAKGESVVSSLAVGLTLLRETLFTRIHEDVERIVGLDSMLVPTSEAKTGTATRLEIELYLTAVSATQMIAADYVGNEDDWVLPWLTRLRLGVTNEAGQRRIAGYLADDDDGRLAFTDVLVRVCPEARRVPLVLFRLFPLSIRLATATAFGDGTGAADLRQRQLDLHPSIADCTTCHGQPLVDGDICQRCGNPVWHHIWLMDD